MSITQPELRPVPLRPTTMEPLTVPDELTPAAKTLLPKALELIAASFSAVRRMAVINVSDPEIAESWAELQLVLDMAPGDAADAYDRFVGEWVASVPWPTRNAIIVTYMFA